MKEPVSKFNIEAAFKALEEIDIPSVTGGILPNKVSLNESIKATPQTDILLEEYYDLNNADDIDMAKEEREAEIAKAKLARIEKIVDLDAETEEDILPSYVGKMIVQCPQCMTLFYKNPEDIEHSEENPDVVNINEVCQHCGNSSGYTLVGKVDKVGEDEADKYDTDEVEDILDANNEANNTEEPAQEEADQAEEASENEEAADDKEATEEPVEESQDELPEPADIPVEDEEEENDTINESLVEAAEDTLPDLTASNIENLFNSAEFTNPITETEVERYLEDINDMAAFCTDDDCENTTLNESEEISDDDFVIKDGVLKFAPNKPNVIVPEGVTSIGEDAFANCNLVESVTIPDSVTSIGNYAFENCSNLTNIDIPESVESIGISAFAGCSNLKNIAIPNGVIDIKNRVFKDCSSLESITIPESVRSIWDYAFYGCNNLKNINYNGKEYSDINEVIDLINNSILEESLSKTSLKESDEAVEDNIVEDSSDETDTVEDEAGVEIAEPVSVTEDNIDLIQETANEVAEAIQDIVEPNEEQAAEIKETVDEIVADKVEEISETEVEEKPEDETEETSEDEAEVQPIDEPVETEDIDEEEIEENNLDDDFIINKIDAVTDDSIEECINKALKEVYSNVDSFKLASKTINEEKDLVVDGTINFKSGKQKSTKYIFNECVCSTQPEAIIIELKGINNDFGEDGVFVLNCKGNMNEPVIAESFSYSYHIGDTLVEGLVK